MVPKEVEMDAPIYFRKAMLEVGDLRIWHAVRRCVAGEQPQVHGHVREGAAALGAEGIRVLLRGVVQYHGAGGKHGPHDRGREELQAEFRTGRFGGYAGSADERDVATQLGGRGGCGRVFPLWRTVVEAIFEGVEKVRLDGGIGWMACLLE